jgi:hypothetical protein
MALSSCVMVCVGRVVWCLLRGFCLLLVCDEKAEDRAT